jgi:hypothetical protein
LVASFNDYRRGDGTCGAAWSVNGGETWQDSTVPNGFVRGAAYGGVARQYFQAGGDTAVAWDTKGNAYLQCQLFMRGAGGGVTNNPDASSAVYVFRSTGNHGASWNFTARPVVETFDFTGAILEDKPFMTVDNTIGSPFQDRIYVTWTEFAADEPLLYQHLRSPDAAGQLQREPILAAVHRTRRRAVRRVRELQQYHHGIR